MWCTFNRTEGDFASSVLAGKTGPPILPPQPKPGSGEIVDGYNLSEAINGKYAVIFFYPLDFTFHLSL